MSKFREQLAYFEEIQILRASAEQHVEKVEADRISSFGLPFPTSVWEEQCKEYLDQVRQWHAALPAPDIGSIAVSDSFVTHTEEEAHI